MALWPPYCRVREGLTSGPTPPPSSLLRTRTSAHRGAEKYLVDDLSSAALVGSRLNGILLKIEAGETLTFSAQGFLTSSGLVALPALATGQINRRIFDEAAKGERSDRIQRAQEDAYRAAAEEARRTEVMDVAIKARFAAMENDPVSIRPWPRTLRRTGGSETITSPPRRGSTAVQAEA
ncbi:hypothetical protein [Oricola nitratireducens]|uniref:hypothetical protein n=1 Tax=Oricola nitratireducens TaxID=2775868 RepID=UPI0018690CA6|nr:hypothetical protein [Oricola nitratireducens]